MSEIYKNFFVFLNSVKVYFQCSKSRFTPHFLLLLFYKNGGGISKTIFFLIKYFRKYFAKDRITDLITYITLSNSLVKCPGC